MTKKNRIFFILFFEIIGIITALIFVYPAFMVIINAFKPLREILLNPFALPKNITIKNIENIIVNMRFFRALGNTIIIAVIVVSVTIVLSAMTGYKLQRFGGKISAIISLLFISCMLVPFQTIVIPIAQIARIFGLVGTTFGYIFIIIPLYAPLGIFVCQGFVKTIPRSLEESAVLDGCNPFRVFFSIVFPLLKSVLSSIAILYFLWIWNDYALAALMIPSEAKRTLTLMVYSGFSTFLNRWDFSIAALALSIIPIMIFYLLMQKYIIRGVIDGAVKG